MERETCTFTDESFFRVSRDVRLLCYDRLVSLGDEETTGDAGESSRRDMGAVEGTVRWARRAYDGYRVTTLNTPLLELLLFLQEAQGYKAVKSKYEDLCTGNTQRCLPVRRMLLSLLQRRLIRICRAHEEPVTIGLLTPRSLEEGFLVTPDMLTFIDESQQFQSAPYIVLNPRANAQHWMDRPEYELAKFISPGRTFAEVRDFYESTVARQGKGNEGSGDLIAACLKPMMKSNLVICIDRGLKRIQPRPSVFVEHRSVHPCKFTPRGFPSSIALIPTNRCNNFCRHCSAFHDDADQPQDGMSYRVLCRLFDEMHDNGLRILRITGGEPFMRSDIFDILDYASNKYFGILLFTNGNRINARNIDRLAAISNRKEGDFMVHVSLDGGQRGHDWFRRTEGAYEKVVHAMRLLRERSIPYYVEMCVHPMMLDEFEDAASVVVRSGARALLAHPAVGVGRGKQHESEFHMAYSDIKDFWQRVNVFHKQHPNFDLRFDSYEIAGASYKQMDGVEEPRDDKGVRQSAARFRPRGGHCTAGLEQLAIDQNGDVYPCPGWTSVGVKPAGNILADSIARIWADPDKWKMSRGSWDYDDIAVCNSCPHFTSCELGKLCRIPSLLWFGTPLGPPPSCVLYHRQLGISRRAVEGFHENVKETADKGFQWKRAFGNRE